MSEATPAEPKYVTATDLAKAIGRTKQQVSNEVRKDRRFPVHIIDGEKRYVVEEVIAFRHRTKVLRHRQEPEGKSKNPSRATSPAKRVEASERPLGEVVAIDEAIRVDPADLADGGPFAARVVLGDVLFPQLSASDLARLALHFQMGVLEALEGMEAKAGRPGLPDVAPVSEWLRILKPLKRSGFERICYLWALAYCNERFANHPGGWWAALARPLESNPFAGSPETPQP